MPARNSRKSYMAGGYYHLYNRGVEKRKIFLDKQDYSVFLSYLKEYLSPKDEKSMLEKIGSQKITWPEKDKLIQALKRNNFAESLTLLAYCLMPNHFHFFIKQKDNNTIDSFMNSLGTRYTMYFNKKYTRVGSLYQGVYKAVPITTHEQFLHLSRYIHRQALFLKGEAFLEKYPSSYYEYLQKRNTSWIQPQEILTHFSEKNPNLSYETFISKNEYFDEPLISPFVIEDCY